MVYRLSLGIIARNFPPALGGMAEHAYGLANALSRTDNVTVYTRIGLGGSLHNLSVKNCLTNKVSENADLLRAEAVDAWLALSAEQVVLADQLPQPLFVYFHGNDFLSPNISPGDTVLGKLHRLPFFWRLKPWYWSITAVPTYYMRKRLINRSLRHAAHVFVNSRNTQALVEREYKCARHKISVVHPGCAEDFFQAKRKVEDSQFRILTVATLRSQTRRKNVDGVLKALHLIRNELPFTYTVVGDGDDRPRLEAVAHELGLADRVRFAGAVSREELIRHYAAADLFILASKASDRDVEGFGMVYVEASAAGVPVICSAEGGATDAVEDGVNGIIIPNSSHESIARGILDLHALSAKFDPGRIRSYAEQFKWPAVAAKIRGAILAHLRQG